MYNLINYESLELRDTGNMTSSQLTISGADEFSRGYAARTS